jgi:hypothetical protein
VRVKAPLFALLSGVIACSRGAGQAPEPPQTTTTSPTDAGAPRVAAPSAPTGTSLAGRYRASPGSLYVPDGGEWAAVRFRGDDASVGLGDGEMAVSVDRAGRAEGSVSGPLGPLRIGGILSSDMFSAALVPDDGGAGFAGTAVGRKTGDRIEGTMRLSGPRGDVIREAPFTLEGRR